MPANDEIDYRIVREETQYCRNSVSSQRKPLLQKAEALSRGRKQLHLSVKKKGHLPLSVVTSRWQILVTFI